MGFFRKHAILASVFATGAAVLVIEVAATRILSPFYGNTVSSVSSILCVILAALSCGYYFGGRFADAHPDTRSFYGLIAAGGAALILLRVVQGMLLPVFAYSFSFTTGPLVWSLLLFFLPCVFLGALSPFAVALRKRRSPEEGMGRVSGEVFFWSTVGSIAGSLLAGFVLIPRFGVASIVGGTAVFLLLLGAAGMAPGPAKGRRILPLVLLAFVGVLASLADVEAGSPVFVRDGAYQKVAVYDGTYEGRPARFLAQDGFTAGAEYLDGDDLVYDYTRSYALHRLFVPRVRAALVIGGGAFSVPKAILRDLPEARVDVVEIEPAVVDAARRFFGLPDDLRLSVTVGDGRAFLHRSDSKYDLIFSDVYQSLIFVPAQLATREFFEEARAKLEVGGVFMANILGDVTAPGPTFLLSEMRTFREVFPNSYFYPVRPPAPGELRNVMFVGVNGDARPGLLESAFAPEDADLSSSPVLTDDYAPVENLAAKGFLEGGRRPAPVRYGK